MTRGERLLRFFDSACAALRMTLGFLLVHFASAAFDNAIALEHADKRPEEALAVEQEALAFHIFAIEGSLYRDFQFVTSVNLSPAGEANGHIVCAVLVAFFDQVVLIPKGRTRTDDAHGSFEDVEHLREFVKTRLAEESANLRNPFLGIAEFMRRSVFRRVSTHGAELVNVEMFLVETDAFLLEKNRSLAIELDGDSNREHRNGKNDDAKSRKHNVYDTLEKNCIESLMH